MNWIQVALVRSTPYTLSHLLKVETTSPLSNAVLLKYRHTMLIWDLPGLDPSLGQATGYLIATNSGELFNDQRAARLEADTLRRRKEDKGADTLLRTTCGDLFNLS